MKHRAAFYSVAILLMMSLACRLFDGPTVAFEQTSPVATARPTDAQPVLSPTESPLATATPRDPGDASQQRYLNAALGIAFEYPAGWLVEPGASTIVIAADLEALNEPAAAASSVVIISLQYDSIIPAEELITLSPDLIFEVKSLVEVGDAQTLTIDGQEAALRTFTGSVVGRPRNLVVYGIRGDSQSVVVLGASTEDSGDGRLIEAIVESISLTAPAAAVGPTADETLPWGQTLTGVVDSSQTIAYAFSGSEGEWVTIVLEPEGDFDAVVDLVTADGRSIVGGAVDETYDIETLEQVRLPEDGQYFILVRGFGGIGGAFSIVLDAAEPATGGPAETADLPHLQSDRAYVATLPTDTTHEYVVTAVDTRPFYVFVDAEGEFDATLAVFDDFGMLQSEVDFAFAGESEALRFEPPAAGDFVIQVAGFLGDGGDYMIGLVFLDEGEETVVSASGSVGSQLPGRHTFTLPEGRVALIVVIPSETLDVMIELYEDGTLVAERDDLSSGSGEAETHIYRGPGGELTLELTGFAGSVGSYDVVVTTAELVERP